MISAQERVRLSLLLIAWGGVVFSLWLSVPLKTPDLYNSLSHDMNSVDGGGLLCDFLQWNFRFGTGA
jgi:hypothetical protein